MPNRSLKVTAGRLARRWVARPEVLRRAWRSAWSRHDDSCLPFRHALRSTSGRATRCTFVKHWRDGNGRRPLFFASGWPSAERRRILCAGTPVGAGLLAVLGGRRAGRACRRRSCSSACLPNRLECRACLRARCIDRSTRLVHHFSPGGRGGCSRPCRGVHHLGGNLCLPGPLGCASSGDSDALLLSGGKARELTAGQHKNPPVGSGAALAVPFTSVMTEPWRILVMSDGVWKYVGWDRVAQIAGRARGVSVIAELQEAARLRESRQFQDDFTVVILEAPVDSSPWHLTPGPRSGPTRK